MAVACMDNFLGTPVLPVRSLRSPARPSTGCGVIHKVIHQNPVWPCQWHVAVAVCEATRRIGGLNFLRRGNRHRRVAVASSRAELLVDGDVNSMDEIREAIRYLEAEHKFVRTIFFGPPERANNKKWSKFFRETDIEFRPVRRSSDPLHEPNDKAIVFAMLKAAMHDVECVALLSVDAGFVNTILEVEQSGSRCVVFIPLNQAHISRTFEAAGVQTVILKTQKTAGGKVIATLHGDGSGSVEVVASSNKLAYNVSYTARSEVVTKFLDSLGFEAHGYTVQSITKFWFTNNLGSLVVYPGEAGLTAVEEVISEEPRNSLWIPYSEFGKLAFFLPVSTKGRMTKIQTQIYGNGLARSIFRGGGPFMLYDSPELVEQALRLLGYLDDEFNTDLTEAMFCFVNASINKKTLAKRGMLPAFGETSVDVQSKLRRAFLSHDFSGKWQLMSKSAEAVKPLQDIIEKAGFLRSRDEYCPQEMFEAMNAYMQQKGLPSMNTFNGRAWRILRASRRNPASTWTGDVEF